jgi:hypothetical protein
MKPLVWGGQGPYKDCIATDDDDDDNDKLSSKNLWLVIQLVKLLFLAPAVSNFTCSTDVFQIYRPTVCNLTSLSK